MRGKRGGGGEEGDNEKVLRCPKGEEIKVLSTSRGSVAVFVSKCTESFNGNIQTPHHHICSRLVMRFLIECNSK